MPKGLNLNEGKIQICTSNVVEGGQHQLMANADRDRMIAGISNPPLTGQRLRADELVSGRALFCPETGKSVSKAEEPRNGQRHKDAEGNGKPLH